MEPTRSFAYLCPACHSVVTQARTHFALLASGADVACDCKKSTLSLRGDGQRFYLSIPCGICGGAHSTTCSPAALLQGRGIGLACDAQKLLCCFIGEEGAVLQEADRLAEIAAKQSAEDRSDSFTDDIIMYEILSELRDIAARTSGITCACGCTQYKMDIRSAAVDLICNGCATKLRIPAATEDDLERLCCQMRLQIPGKKIP